MIMKNQPNRAKRLKIIAMILQFALAGIFIFAGAGKIQNPVQFAEAIDNYRLLPYLAVSLLAVFLPWLEIFCRLFLIFGR